MECTGQDLAAGDWHNVPFQRFPLHPDSRCPFVEDHCRPLLRGVNGQFVQYASACYTFAATSGRIQRVHASNAVAVDDNSIMVDRVDDTNRFLCATTACGEMLLEGSVD